ncbi:DUF4811 domain-containing protein [Fructobacillus fructosus]|uniref:DUF4811 domain-containing protein n=1 Tax=Fructobacillus fructosus TaxID=1631 RepID=UPI0016589365|nr:DUF4811 domain-containing protein [Fructobacillus fructosus]MBC9119143.1 DUF4811 domain-containing protein [Fructobacillus fructosus]MBD9366340.1 DUF4811 domain-containing protein [Leuconostoc mesenteroides]
MLIWIIALLAILTMVSIFALKMKSLKVIFGGLFAILTLASSIMLAANMDSHYGMEKTTTTSTKQVYSILPAQSPVNAVAVKKIGSDNYVLVYKDAATDAQGSAHFIPNTKKVVEAVKQRATYQEGNVTTAEVKTKTVKWTYKSDFYKFLFKQKDEDNTVSVRHTLIVPENWQVVEK